MATGPGPVGLRLIRSPSSRPSSAISLPVLLSIIAFSLVLLSGSGASANDDEVDYSPGLLSRAHEGLDDPDSCDSCHNDDFEVEGDRCLVCHDRIAERMAAGKGLHRDFTIDDCAMCHAEHGGRDAEMLPLDRADFDHAAETGFVLEGFHAEFAGDCSRCHTTRSFLELEPTCASCHGDAHKGTLGGDCTKCHQVDRHFKSASRAFHKSALMPLEGRHLEVPCADCHLDAVIEGTPTRCYDCHWIRRQDSPHRTRLGNECEDCHRPISWLAVSWEHGAATGFNLNGAHHNVDCTGCHPEHRYDLPADPDCYACHMEDYSESREPDHAAAGFPTDCRVCHSPADSSWRGASFAHTGYPLVGRHATLDCDACHSSGVYQGLPSDCVDCHLDNYNAAADPNHVAAGFPTACDSCHGQADPDWNQGTYPHTIYPLVASHAALSCSSCHSSGVYQGLPSDCVDCHLDDYNATTSPAHGSAGFPTDCQACHEPTSWRNASFGHTGYPLVGRHATLDCDACHSSGVYQGLPSDCVDCHLDDYNAAADPDHVAAGFPTACDSCHGQADPDWNQGTYPHTIYPLVASHAAQSCSSCHSSGVYQSLPSDCVDCHLDDYNATTSPNHGSAGFPTDCQVCHEPTSWRNASFGHTGYPLVGRHATLDCDACHSSGVYQGLPSDCVDCHLGNYNATADPDHVAAGFPTTCDSCHDAADPDWNQGTYPHTIYPLVASHAALSCSSCHSSGMYQGLPSDCVDCHLDDYNATTSPAHGSAGFPTDCQVCHEPTSWTDATFNHSYELVGTHATLDCDACHSSGVYQGLPSDCVDCHLGNYNATADPDHVAAGFPTTCDSCHDAADPDWNQGTFAHSFYPLLGSHAQQQCITCHSNGVYQGLPSDCVDCHLDDYNAANNPNHVAAGFPTLCELCHQPSDPSWDLGTFDHVYFPITSGPHRGAGCDRCHVDPSNFGVFSCTTGGCHPRSRTDDDHADVMGYVYQSPACYSCHPSGQADGGFSPTRRLRASH